MVNTPTSSYGFLLQLVSEATTNGLLFYSKDCGDSTKFPKLEITYGCEVSLKLHPKADAAIGYHDNYNTANNNYGTAVQNAAYCIPGTQGGLNKNRALIDFDLSSVPSANSILSARLNLYATGPLGVLSGHTGTANSVNLQRVVSTWAESIVTWNNQPSSSTVNQILLPTSTSATQDYLNIDVTNLVKDMVNNPTSSYGFLLQLVNEVTTNGLLFYSKDCGDSTKFPMLEISMGCDSVLEGIEGQKDGFVFSVFPNPARGQISVQFSNDLTAKEPVLIKLYDFAGRELLRTTKVTTNNQANINLASLSAGIYILSLNIDGLVSNKRIVITAE